MKYENEGIGFAINMAEIGAGGGKQRPQDAPVKKPVKKPTK